MRSHRRSAEDHRRPPGLSEFQADERTLLHRYRRTGDPAIQEELVQRFMPLARSLAMRYRSTSEPADDLLQVASLGLLKALKGFDPDRGKSFAAYAAPTILGELRRHFRDRVWNLHLPRILQERTQELEKAITKLTERHGRTPTVREIAAQLELDDEDVLEAIQAREARRTLSLDRPVSDEDPESSPMMDRVATKEMGYDAVEAQLAAQTSKLDEREHKVLRMRFVEDLNQYQIADRIGVSQMQVSRILRGALRKLLVAVQGKSRAEAV